MISSLAWMGVLAIVTLLSGYGRRAPPEAEICPPVVGWRLTARRPVKRNLTILDIGTELAKAALTCINGHEPIVDKVELNHRDSSINSERLQMTLNRRIFVLSQCLLPTVLLIGTGCSTTPPVAQSYEETPVGSVMTFSRRSSGSYGSGEAKSIWSYSEGSWQGRRMLKAVNSLGGGTFHDPKTFGIVATLNAAGQPTMSFDPPVGIEWPLVVGKAWTTQHTVTLYPSNQKVELGNSWKVEAFETITVPAGRFAVYRVVRTGSDGEVETRWVSTQRGVPLVKRTQVRPATHRQGAGAQEGELLEYKVPR